eukprot:scaffold298947_cov32-Tisochrysis_lutea.AAC.2
MRFAWGQVRATRLVSHRIACLRDNCGRGAAVVALAVVLPWLRHMMYESSDSDIPCLLLLSCTWKSVRVY